MGRIIDVDYAKLFDMGAKFEEQGMKIKSIKEVTEANFNAINEAWAGKDSFNYVNNSIDLVNELNGEMLYMLTWAEFFTRASYRYGNHLEEGLARLNNIRNILDQYNKPGMDVNQL